MARKRKAQYPVHTGNHWYVLRGGEKVHGKAKALAAHSRNGGRGGGRAKPLSLSSATSSGRQRFLRRAGLQYKGLRDVYTSAGYVEEGGETFDHFWSLYERDPVAGRIIDMPPKTTWRTPPEVVEGEGGKENATKFEEAWLAHADDLKIWRHFERVDRLSRVGRYAVLLIGARGGDDRTLGQEMEQMQGPQDVLYLAAYSEKYAEIKDWDMDPGSKRFGLPKTYELELSSGVRSFKSGKVLVHHSRIIHVAEDPLTDDVYGRPALKRALNVLTDLLKVTASTGESFWQLANRILHAKIDPEAEMKDKTMENMGAALEDMVHDLRRQFVGQGVDLGWLGGETPKPAEALAMYISMMGVASGIPARMLFGSEQSQLASSQDERSFFGMVNERQEQHAEPNILRAYIDRLVGIGGLPPPGEKEGYSVVWSPLFELSDKDIAEANLLRAKAAKELTPIGGSPLDLVEIDAERNVWLAPKEYEEPEPEPLEPDPEPEPEPEPE